MTPAPNANVLLVDDQPANLLALEAMLGGLGYTLVRAHSGPEALRLLRRDDFAVVLLDVQMPGLDGFDTARLIRGRQQSLHTPIIFLTAYDLNRLTVEEAYALGAVDYLVKPLLPAILRAKVAAFVELFHMRRREVERALAEENARLREEHLRGQAEALRQADRRKDQFLATLAHELKNPLAPVRTAVQVLRLKGSDDPDLRSCLDIVARQTGHLARLVDDLLDLSGIKRGTVRLRTGPVELAQVVADAVAECRPRLEARRHALEVSVPAPLRLEADATRLCQVVANLLANAATYTPEGGHVRLTAEAEGGEAVLRVSDDGIGIGPDRLPRLFDLFAQAEAGRDDAPGGLGLGLALVKSLVELHGGTVEARSAGPGLGSAFVVRLPLRPPSPSRPAGDVPPGGPAPPRRVLVVDDNADAAESLALLLRLRGHDVRTAHTGQAALEAAGAFVPEVVLLDLGLPGGPSGYELAPLLRGLPGMGDALLAALTGHGQGKDRRRSYAAGFDAHLSKPADPDALDALLARGSRKG